MHALCHRNAFAEKLDMPQPRDRGIVQIQQQDKVENQTNQPHTPRGVAEPGPARAEIEPHENHQTNDHYKHGHVRPPHQRAESIRCLRSHHC